MVETYCVRANKDICTLWLKHVICSKAVLSKINISYICHFNHIFKKGKETDENLYTFVCKRMCRFILLYILLQVGKIHMYIYIYVGWMIVFLQNSHSQCDGIKRWGLWEVTMSETRIPMHEISALIKETPDSSLALSTMWRKHKEKIALEELGSHWILKLQAPWSWISKPPLLWAINICCLSHPVYDIFYSSPNIHTYIKM